MKETVIQFHSDTFGSDGHPAVNVKTHGMNFEAGDVPKADNEAAWEMLVEMWWNNATIVAQQHGYSGVFSEGRSGGWCVPYFQYANGKLQTKWTGQGPDKGYPTYPDVNDSKERRRFVAFRKDIVELLEDAPNMYKQILADLRTRSTTCGIAETL